VTIDNVVAGATVSSTLNSGNHSKNHNVSVIIWARDNSFNSSVVLNSTKINDSPAIIALVNPANNSPDVLQDAVFNLTVFDADNDTFTLNVFLDQATPITLRFENTSINDTLNNASFTLSMNASVLDFETVYRWKANVTNNESQLSESLIYRFTTLSDDGAPPSTGGVSGSIGVGPVVYAKEKAVELVEVGKNFFTRVLEYINGLLSKLPLDKFASLTLILESSIILLEISTP